MARLLGVLLVAAVAGAACASEPPARTGGPCTYEDFDTACRPFDTGVREGRTSAWGRYRPDGWPPIVVRLEVETPPEHADEVLAALNAPRRCHGTYIVSGSCNPRGPFEFETPPLISGARVVFQGLE